MKNRFKLNAMSWLLLLGIVLFTPGNANAQDLDITGTVSDENSNPLPGVTVLIKDTSTGTTTDFDGLYTIKASPNDVLSFSYLGYITQEIPVGTKTSINLSLEPDTQALDEVVVTALGISRDKQTLGYAVQELGGDKLTTTPEANVINSLSGKLPVYRLQMEEVPLDHLPG